RPAVLRPRFCLRQHAQQQTTDRKPMTGDKLHNSLYLDFSRSRLLRHLSPRSTTPTRARENRLPHSPPPDHDPETHTPESSPAPDLRLLSQAPATRRHILSSPLRCRCPIRTGT